MSLPSTPLKDHNYSTSISDDNPCTPAYDNLSKSQLVQKIQELESKLKQKEVCGPKHKVRSKCKSKMDFEKIGVRRIALKISYIGLEYLGFSSYNKAEDFTFENRDYFPLKTIEDFLYRALLTCRLVKDRAWSEYSLCGRTDKGVSGVGQVVSIKVRSNLSREDLEKDCSILSTTDKKEFDFPEMINRLLPSNINVLSWAPVPLNFNARFDCSARHYKYFFLKENLEIEKMQLACQTIVGDHDFRNLCKQDTSKDIATYVRTMKEIYISPCTQNRHDWYELNIIGNSFLWHQVRCIMAVLFLVGNKQEDPEVFDLLFGTFFKGKPAYELASPYPLVFYKAHYDNIKLNWQSSLQYSSYYKVNKMLYENRVKTYLMTNNLESLLRHRSTDPNPKKNSNITLGAGLDKKCNNYKPLNERNQLEPPAERREKYKIKKAKVSE